MGCEAGHFENPGDWTRLIAVGADGNADGLHPGTKVPTENAWPSPSQVGEDEVSRDEVA